MSGERSSFVGTARLTRFIVRRDRIRIAVWVAGILALVAVTVSSVKGLYPTQESLDQAAAVAEGNAAAIAFNGPAQGLDTVGGEVAFQVGAFGLVVVALMSLLMIGRLTRGEEEDGRTELIRSLPVGRHAPTTAASLAVAAMNVAVGLVVTLTLLAQDLPIAGSVTFATSWTLTGLLFGATALVAAQITENTRVVYGLAGLVLGASFILRAVGDIGDGTISWLSPIGLAQKTRPFAGELYWPLLLIVLVIAGLLAVSGAFAARRDLGGGLVASRPGRPSANRSLGNPVGLAIRLQRGGVIGWSIGILFTGIAYGSVADSVDDFVRDNKSLADMLAHVGGGNLTDSYLAFSLRILALVGSGFAIQSTLRIRTEETALRAETVLATPTSRLRWAMSHTVVACGGSVVVLVVAGLATGLSYGIVGRDLGVAPRVLGAALVYLPAMWLMVGFTIAVVGLIPRAVAVTWAALAVCFVVGFLGNLLDLPNWLMNVSPFEHIPEMPAAGLGARPLVIVSVVAGLFAWAGLAGLRRRDIG